MAMIGSAASGGAGASASGGAGAMPVVPEKESLTLERMHMLARFAAHVYDDKVDEDLANIHERDYRAAVARKYHKPRKTENPDAGDITIDGKTYHAYYVRVSDLSLLKLSSRPEDQSLLVGLFYNDEELIIAFRGTDNLGNWIKINANFLPTVPSWERTTKLEAHTGFASAIDKFWRDESYEVKKEGGGKRKRVYLI